MSLERFPAGRKYSGVLLSITAAILLLNLRIIPTAAPAYDVAWNYLVPTAIPLLPFQADLGRVVRESGPTLAAAPRMRSVTHIASAGTEAQPELWSNPAW